jgi:hypothetical protein
MSKNIMSAIRELFFVRDDCYPMQLDGLNEYKVIKNNLTADIIARHIRGDITIGSFQINPKNNTVKWICFDFDGDLKEEFDKAKKLFLKLKQKGFSPLLEFSGRRGYHVWLFVEPTDAKIAREFAVKISEEHKPNEIFPKQDKIEKDGFGGQVKVPLGLHRASDKWSYLFDDKLKILSKEWGIKHIIKISEKEKDEIKTKNLSQFI